MLLNYDAWNWLNFSQKWEKYSDNFQEPSNSIIDVGLLSNMGISGVTLLEGARGQGIAGCPVD